MKKIIIILVAILFSFILISCDKKVSTSNESALSNYSFAVGMVVQRNDGEELKYSYLIIVGREIGTVESNIFLSVGEDVLLAEDNNDSIILIDLS